MVNLIIWITGMHGNRHSINGNAKPVDGESLLAEGRLLDGLGHWVDRLFDGSLPKCKIEFWPLFPTDEVVESSEDSTEKKSF